MDKLAENSNPDAFSLKKVTQDVKDSIAEACKLPAAERKKALRDMRMRWHPDKNSMLKEFAAEIFKIVNDELHALEEEGKKQQEESPTKRESPLPIAMGVTEKLASPDRTVADI